MISRLLTTSSRTKALLEKIEGESADATTLVYHEKLLRKDEMLPVAQSISAALTTMRKRLDELRHESGVEADSLQWPPSDTDFSKVETLCHELDALCERLESVFLDLGSSIVLANIEDRIKIIVTESLNRERSTSILYSWKDLSVVLMDTEELSETDISPHEAAINSLIGFLIEGQECLENDQMNRSLRNGSIGQAPSLSILSGDGESLHDQPGIKLNERRGSKASSSLTPSEPVQNNNGPEVHGDQPERPVNPDRLSGLFVDLNNTVRGPLCQAYLIYLLNSHPTLAARFARIQSTGLTADKGVPLAPGVDFLLRDRGINQNLKHTSRRFDLRELERFEHVLVMNSALKDEIIKTWLSRESDRGAKSQHSEEDEFLTLELVKERVRELGSYGDEDVQEVARVASIDGQAWFQVGKRRIYPGYETCLRQIKSYLIDFVYSVTGYDVVAGEMSASQEIDSRQVSDDEDSENDADFGSSPRSTGDRAELEDIRHFINSCWCLCSVCSMECVSSLIQTR